MPTYSLNKVNSIINTQCKENYFLYVTHPGANAISVLKINPTTGDLTKKYDIKTVQSPGDLHLQQNKYVYTFGNWDRIGAVYVIESTGDSVGYLKEIQKTVVGDLPFNLSFDNAGKYLYLSNTLNNNISMFAVHKNDGTLAPLSPATYPSDGNGPAGFSMNPNSGDFAYVTNYYEDSISVYGIDKTTHLLISLNKKYKVGIYARLAWFDQDNHAYVLNLKSNTISMFYADPKTGDLTPLSPARVKTGVEPITLAIEPSGKYVYVGTRMDDLIHVYIKNESTGVLESVARINPDITATPSTDGSNKQKQGGHGPRNMIIYTINNQSYLYLSNSFDTTISKFKLDANGFIESNSTTINDTEVLNPEVIVIAKFNVCK